MLTLNRRRAVAAAALALLFVVPLPLTSQTKPAEPLSMQVAKRGDAKNTHRIETSNFTVVFSEQGAQILEFRNRDNAYPRRDGANIVIPGTEIFLAPYLGATGTAQYVGANLAAMMYAAFSFSKTENDDTVKIVATAPVVLLADKAKYDATFVKEFVFLKKSPYFKFSLEIQTNAPVKLQIGAKLTKGLGA
ncbi:MAG TPA: hypothetical protein PLF85_15185, partial [Turneriella sp.]|nr:hypothetical protein [Turneriella sp.]